MDNTEISSQEEGDAYVQEGIFGSELCGAGEKYAEVLERKQDF